MESALGDPSDRSTFYRNRLATVVRTVRTGLPLLLSAVLISGAAPPENLQEALQAQRSLVAQNPSDADQLNDLGNLLALTGDLAGAEEAYRRALEIEPGSTTTLYNMALVLQEQGKSKEARQALQSILETNPDHAWGHYQLGTIYETQSHRTKALRHYERAFKLDRSLVDPKVNPHIVENRLATEALLLLYVAQSPSTQAPRLYRDPGNVADLLLPAETQEAYVEETSDPDPAASDQSTRQYRATFQPRTGVSQAWDSTGYDDELDDMEDDSQNQVLDDDGLSSSGNEPISSSPSGWSGTASTLRPGGYEGSTFGQESAPIGQQAAPAGVAAPPPVRRITSEDLRTTSAPRAQQDSFTPGIESTGRLDIELLPAADSTSTIPAS